MNIAVVYPEVYDIAKFGDKRKEFPPFGVMYLAASIERAGISVKLLKISIENTRLDLRDYDAVAFSIPSSVTYPIVKECRFTSLFGESALIMAGGIHANIYPEETLLDLQVDVLGIGEGDITILEILAEANTRRFEKVKGVCYLVNSKPVFTSPRPLLDNLDALPFPARHLMDADDFIMNNRLSTLDLKMTHIMFSRGCPFSCYFCAAAQTKLQYRSGESVRQELIHLKEVYGIEGFSVVDDNNIINKRNIVEICESIADLGFQWNALSRVDTINQEVLTAMKKAGCIEIVYGVESGSEKILKAMNKKITLGQIHKALDAAYSIGIKIKIFLIHGFPGENAQTTQETMNFLKQVAPQIHRVSLFRFVPLPGTHVHKHFDKFQLQVGDFNYASHDWSKYHIHHNNYHWWGTTSDFQEMAKAYDELEEFVQTRWPSRFS